LLAKLLNYLFTCLANKGYLVHNHPQRFKQTNANKVKLQNKATDYIKSCQPLWGYKNLYL
jgi:hypothetical protein